ncbi:uncharacterized protein A1O9_01472 [Exophiala aquamarina CBS 119918]|uniref:Beta-hexosaminidase n=1 Tax=Exophiala aquamarina CBS 119918 TaxID=1182545 RepID=A0A072PTR3_9EURO|nr:uncharacterized protein A1O9_01472 [Exophiala aquamarina CBS 119918]KEF63494.1 hypothetical protein A1O9_01472 [Exophiala aquamarina CBS 119918]
MINHFLAVMAYASMVCALWPKPRESTTGNQILWLNPGSLKAVLRCGNAETVLLDPDLDSASTVLENYITDALHWTQSLLEKVPMFSENRTTDRAQPHITENLVLRNAVRETFKSIDHSEFIPWKLRPRHSRFEPNVDLPRQYISVLEIRQTLCPSNEILHPQEFFDGSEVHEIFIHNSTAILRSDDILGTLRGLQSLQQLFYSHSDSSEHYTNLVPVTISDSPKWKHRGISIDIARNPFQPRDLIRTIDAMARAKLSRLHVHATDSQSWPIEIPCLPDLARKGAYHPGLVWTTKDLEHIQSYGVSKGISVFIEIDMPGHTASIAHAYPNLIAAFNELDWSTFAAEPLSGQLKLNSSEVTNFVTEVLYDLLPRSQPFTSLYHIGGDEVNLPAYLLDETVHSDDPKILQSLLQRFIDHIVGIASGLGFQPIVWEEMLLDWNLTLPSATSGTRSASTLVQVWRNSKRIEEVLKKGYRVIFGDYGHWYLDCGYGNFLDPYPSGRSPSGVPFNTSGGFPSKVAAPYLDYCNPFHNWRHIYTYNPLGNVSSALHHLIEGGEVLMWSEQTDSFDLDTKLWPRAGAAAEVLWSGIRDESMLADASKRLGEWRERTVGELDIRMSPVQMTWCLMEGGCNL